jgi:hypothetical protein
MDMGWEKPTFVDVAMNAEIGAYQEDHDRGNAPVIAAAAVPARNEPVLAPTWRGGELG